MYEGECLDLKKEKLKVDEAISIIRNLVAVNLHHA
jgi:hypothetical protein